MCVPLRLPVCLHPRNEGPSNPGLPAASPAPHSWDVCRAVSPVRVCLSAWWAVSGGWKQPRAPMRGLLDPKLTGQFRSPLGIQTPMLGPSWAPWSCASQRRGRLALVKTVAWGAGELGSVPDSATDALCAPSQTPTL